MSPVTEIALGRRAWSDATGFHQDFPERPASDAAGINSLALQSSRRDCYRKTPQEFGG